MSSVKLNGMTISRSGLRWIPLEILLGSIDALQNGGSLEEQTFHLKACSKNRFVVTKGKQGETERTTEGGELTKLCEALHVLLLSVSFCAATLSFSLKCPVSGGGNTPCANDYNKMPSYIFIHTRMTMKPTLCAGGNAAPTWVLHTISWVEGPQSPGVAASGGHRDPPPLTTAASPLLLRSLGLSICVCASRSLH